MRILVLISAFLFFWSQHSCTQAKCDCEIPEKSVSAIPGVDAFNNFDLGVTCASKCNKPIFLFFTGWACVSSRKMEEEILTPAQNLQLLQNEFVVICLYVDDKRKLPENQFETRTHNDKTFVVNTIGGRNLKLQGERFNSNAQPLSIILSPNGEDVITSFGYTPDALVVNNMIREALKSTKE